MTAKEISEILATQWNSPVHYVRNILVPNVSWSFLPWEADLLAISKSGYLTEVEIKISLSDWKADNLKRKWMSCYAEDRRKIKRFYYACPPELAARWQEIPDLQKHAGVLSVAPRHIEVLRHPETQKGKKLDEADMLRIARLGCLKYWDIRRKS